MKKSRYQFDAEADLELWLASPDEQELPGTNATTSKSQPGQIRMLVSSKHLRMASSYFRNMLNGPWKESATKGSIKTVAASEWDEQAFVIVMDIVHGHSREVPKKVDLELLCKIAIVVDYYGFHEVMGPYVELWVGDMNFELASAESHGQECILWICISWVFSLGLVFQRMTSLAVNHGIGLIEAPSLPIHKVLDKVNVKRIELINQALQIIPRMCDALTQGYDECSFECSSMLLGSLTKAKYAFAHRLQPPLISPFGGYSVNAITGAISNLGELDGAVYMSLHSIDQFNCRPCIARQKLNESIEQVKEGFKGFMLEDMKAA